MGGGKRRKKMSDIWISDGKGSDHGQKRGEPSAQFTVGDVYAQQQNLCRKGSLEILMEREAKLKEVVEIARKREQREREKKEAEVRIAILEKEIARLSRKNKGTFALSDDEEGDIIIPPTFSSDLAEALQSLGRI